MVKTRKKEKPIIEARGKGVTGKGSARPIKDQTIIEATLSCENTESLTSYDVFSLCIERSANLIKIHKAAHGKKSKPEKYLADAHRAAIVLAVSALDAFMRMSVISRIRGLLVKSSTALPPALADKIKRFLRDDGLLEAARKDDLLDRVEKAFQGEFEKVSFQGTRRISEYMKLVGYDDIFHDIALKAAINEDNLKGDLDKFTNRRHLIAHKGDYDLSQNPPRENVVTKQNVKDCIKLVKIVAKHIHEIG